MKHRETRSRIVGLMCVLGAQWACAPEGSDPANDVGTVQSAIKVNIDTAGHWQTYFQLFAWPAQRQITYCIAGVGPNPPQFPDSSFQTVIANAYAAVGAPWNNAGDLLISHGSDANCGTASSTTTVNVVYDNLWPMTDHPQPGQALTDQGYPNSPSPRTVRIGERPSPSPTQRDYNWQAIHEFGHVLGFQDQSAIDTTKIYEITVDPLTIMDNLNTAQNLMSDLDRIGVAKAYGLPFSSLGIPSGVTLAGKPAISTWGAGHFDVFARGTDNKLYWKKTDNNGATWTSWSAVAGGGTIADAPAAVSWGFNRIDVFARGTASDLKHAYFASGTWTWDPLVLANNLQSSAGVSSWASGRLDVFYRSSINQLHHRWYDTGTGWGAVDDNWGGTITSSPSAVSWAVNRIDIVAKGASNVNDVQHFFFTGTPPGTWESLGGVIDSDPAISSWGANHLDIFVRNSNLNLFRVTYNNGWPQWPVVWENLLGHVNSGPSAVSLSPLANQIDVVVLGSSGDVQFTYRDPTTVGVYRGSPGLVKINCGDNGAFPPFIADTDFSGGSQKTRADAPITIDSSNVDPAPIDVYKSQHYGSSFTYTIPGFAANSGHVIRLHFAETNPLNNHIGARVFSVTVNGKPEIDNLDLYKTIGLNHAYIREIAQPANSTGKYVLVFTASVDAATISAIEVM